MKSLISCALLLFATSTFAAVVQPVGASSQVLIPAAGSTAGANGTFFRSDITLINLATHDQIVAFQWLPQGASAGAATTITIRARAGIRSADFVHDYLNQSGLGSIIITGVTSAGTLDTTAVLYASARIWTPEPGTNGTTSQSFYAIPMNTILTPGAALFSMGSLVNPTNYRVNVGIVNVDPNNAQTFVINVPTAGAVPPPPAITITLPPLSMQQVSVNIDALNSNGLGQVTIANATPAATASNRWTAYASTIDNVTGDAWSEIAVAGSPTP